MSDIEKHQNLQQETIASEDDNVLKAIDTVHQDEAMRVLAAYQGPETWTEQEEKSLRRKIDVRLMPVLCLTYGLQYYDKAMLSQAVSHLCKHFERTADLGTRLCSDSVMICIYAQATGTPCLQPSSISDSSLEHTRPCILPSASLSSVLHPL